MLRHTALLFKADLTRGGKGREGEGRRVASTATLIRHTSRQ